MWFCQGSSGVVHRYRAVNSENAHATNGAMGQCLHPYYRMYNTLYIFNGVNSTSLLFLFYKNFNFFRFPDGDERFIVQIFDLYEQLDSAVQCKDLLL
jgi:hypothetical protein